MAHIKDYLQKSEGIALTLGEHHILMSLQISCQIPETTHNEEAL